MPRGRHRHSPPLHRLLPPSAVAGASVLCASGAWLLADPLALRLLVAATAAAAVTGAVLMRTWDRTAGRRVAELTRARASDQWKTEERIAELEADLEESRVLRAKLDTKLRAKRVELAGLRNEHAELLRRYATAETERASALEGRRRLALGSSAGASAGASAATPATGAPGPREQAPASGTSTAPASPVPASAPSSGPTGADYLRAAQALRRLTRNAAAQEARRIAEAALRPAPGGTAPAPRPVSAAAAIVPYAAQRRPAPRLEGGFDFFGTQKGAGGQGDAGDARTAGARTGETGAGQGGAGQGAGGQDGTGPGRGGGPAAALEAAVQQEDLADVVGEEALADRRPDGRRDTEQAVGQVIDLTAHDETEQLDVVRLRDAVNS
ncbi:hypothetical protein [Streptomyces sp. DH12]|uniref:hypothetical protein n=1 Tax=Streptomyces sp. DH12 TaxID=2857010 RepID=UPI001E4096B2|nr:hypothetical protein [Streptomyces sp. DH12]